MLPTTRKDALVLGATRYFTGKSCKNGHVAEWNTKGTYCVKCNAEVVARRGYSPERWLRWAHENPDKLRERNQRKRERYAENPELFRGYRIRWEERNPEYRREHYQTNRERILESTKEWQRNNLDKRRVQNATARARRLAAEGTYTVEDFKVIIEAQKSRCIACGKEKKLTADHRQPLSKGGSNWPSNIQGLCRSCNSKKSAKDPIKFMREQGKLL